jgi:hypothetical protein
MGIRGQESPSQGKEILLDVLATNSQQVWEFHLAARILSRAFANLLKYFNNYTFFNLSSLGGKRELFNVKVWLRKDHVTFLMFVYKQILRM